jgi:hypothetical protein
MPVAIAGSTQGVASPTVNRQLESGSRRRQRIADRIDAMQQDASGERVEKSGHRIQIQPGKSAHPESFVIGNATLPRTMARQTQNRHRVGLAPNCPASGTFS